MKRLLIVLCFAALPLHAADEVPRLHALFDRTWEALLREEPLLATAVGRNEFNDRLPSAAPADLKRRNDLAKDALAELGKIDRAQLPSAERVNYDIFERQLRDAVASYELGDYEIPFTADSGFHTGFARLAQEVPMATTKDYENYIARLRAWPRYVREQIANMRSGLKRGMTVPRATLEGYDVTMSAHVLDDASKSVFWTPFATFPSSVPEADRERLRVAGRAAVVDGAIAGYRELLDFFRREYLPGARTTLGASELPNGRAYYEQKIREFTTLDLTADQIHQTGLSEVARIAAEMNAAMTKSGWKGDFASFLQFLRTDPRFYAKTPEQLLAHASRIAKIADGKLPSLFGTLPRLPYTVEPVPPELAPKYTTGRYVGAAAGSTQPGIYWVNTYKLDSRPLYNLVALTLHEAVPGHHLQIALSLELGQLPPFRRYSYNSAFGEGWGLYSEWLGIEAGMYSDPYDDFGRLTYEMWRACRLVVDTGLHSKGWTRQQAIDYMATRTALPLHEVTTEVDRYISWPGQALAYKLGELKIKELRRRAEKALGTSFDVRAFHDVVLGSGSVPLSVLELNVDAWIATRAQSTPDRGQSAVGAQSAEGGAQKHDVARQQSSEVPAAVPAALRPLAALVGPTWLATFPNGKMTDEQKFEWVFGGKFLRNQHWGRNTEGKVVYQGETIYALDPASNQVVWWYWNSTGGYLTGTQTTTEGGLLAEGVNHGPKGQTAKARGLIRNITADSWESVQYFEREGTWVEQFTIVYRKQ